MKDSDLGGEKFGVLWGLPIYSSDTIFSVAYAGEEVLMVLLPVMGLLAAHTLVYVMCAIIALLLILVFCYRQTIDAYPQGGGAYIVGADNLGEAPGLTAESSLLVGYILTVAVSSCSGAAAVASAFPERGIQAVDRLCYRLHSYVGQPQRHARVGDHVRSAHVFLDLRYPCAHRDGLCACARVRVAAA